jgi:hypothetical protein
LKSTDIANVWHVSKGDFSEVGKGQRDLTADGNFMSSTSTGTS